MDQLLSFSHNGLITNSSQRTRDSPAPDHLPCLYKAYLSQPYTHVSAPRNLQATAKLSPGQTQGFYSAALGLARESSQGNGRKPHPLSTSDLGEVLGEPCKFQLTHQADRQKHLCSTYCIHRPFILASAPISLSENGKDGLWRGHYSAHHSKPCLRTESKVGSTNFTGKVLEVPSLEAYASHFHTNTDDWRGSAEIGEGRLSSTNWVAKSHHRPPLGLFGCSLTV